MFLGHETRNINHTGGKKGNLKVGNLFKIPSTSDDSKIKETLPSFYCSRSPVLLVPNGQKLKAAFSRTLLSWGKINCGLGGLKAGVMETTGMQIENQ